MYTWYSKTLLKKLINARYEWITKQVEIYLFTSKKYIPIKNNFDAELKFKYLNIFSVV